MVSLFSLGIFFSLLSLITWIYLVCFHGQYWLTFERLNSSTKHPPIPPEEWPSVSIIVPARNEAEILPKTLPSLLDQDYHGPYEIILVDDHSEDDTSRVALEIAQSHNRTSHFKIVNPEPLPEGWTGKVWAMEQGVRSKGIQKPEFYFFTDADIKHPISDVQTLVSKALNEKIDLTSIVVHLKIQNFFGKLLIPAFVYFFALLYPFKWVNNSKRKTSAAAGGVILVRRDSLEAAGGLYRIRNAIIDDCSLAKIIKNRENGERGSLWLGLSKEHQSLRGNGSFKEIWSMVVRTAFTQLRYSLFLLAGAIAAIAGVFLIPLFEITRLAFMWLGESSPVEMTGITGIASVIWILMSITYIPFLRWYNVSVLFAPLLPFISLFYILMMIHSAIRTWRGKGAAWKGRYYPPYK